MGRHVSGSFVRLEGLGVRSYLSERQATTRNVAFDISRDL